MDDDLVRNVARLAEWENGRAELLALARRWWWGWEAARLAMPEAVTWPRPKRPRGRDPDINAIRNSLIYHDVERAVAAGMSYRAAYRAVAHKHPMHTHKAIEAICRKVRQSAAE